MKPRFILAAKADAARGDILSFPANPLFEATNKTSIGADQGFCIRIVVSGKSSGVQLDQPAEGWNDHRQRHIQ